MMEHQRIPTYLLNILVSLTGLVIVSVLYITWSGITSDNIYSTSNTDMVYHYQDIDDDQHLMNIDISAHPPDEQCKKRLPGAIIVGIQKCGTTTLLRFLDDHPQIAAYTEAEPKYFSNRYNKSIDWYRELMPCSYSNQVTMEKSPPYFYRKFCAERIRKMDPNTKIIITVKEPIDRAVSMYAMMVDHGYIRENVSFKEYITSHRGTIIKTQSKMLDFSNYPKHMKYWLDNFDRKQILILDGHNLIADPSFELQKVEKFLNIGSYFSAERFMFNETKGMYCILDKTGTPSCMGSNKGRPHPVISEDIRTKLQTYFKPLNEQFFKMIGRRFEWGY